MYLLLCVRRGEGGGGDCLCRRECVCFEEEWLSMEGIWLVQRNDL